MIFAHMESLFYFVGEDFIYALNRYNTKVSEKTNHFLYHVRPVLKIPCTDIH